MIHFHGYDAFMDSIIEQYGAAYRTAFSTAAAVIAVSAEMEGQLRSLGVPPSKLHSVVYGVDAEAFSPAPAVAGPVFLAVGRFVDKKAPHLTVLAFSRVVAEVPEARLVMAGDGPLLEPCRHLVRALRLTEHVSFPGVLQPAGVAAAMRGARAFVQHSVIASSGDREGTPVAVLEAMASGLPVVATRHGGIADVVTEEETGALVQEYDVENMAAAMTRLARDGDLSARMGAAGRRRILGHFTVEASIHRLASILFTASHSAPGPRGRR